MRSNLSPLVVAPTHRLAFAVRAATRFVPSLLTTPGQLRGMLVGVGTLAVVLFGVTFAAIHQHRQGMQTVGMDAAPSIVAAERVKAGMAAMHGHAARELLGKPDAAKAYDTQREEVVEGLMVAAGNITYGDAERVPIRTMLNGIGRYEGAVAAARALAAKGDRDVMIRQFREADVIMQRDLIPAAEALDKANSTELEREYARQKQMGIVGRLGVLVAGLSLIAAMVSIQIYLRRRTRRVFNPALVLATALTVVVVGYTLSALDAERRHLRLAREDAFASLQVLWQARADGYNALAAERLGRLDPDRAQDAALRCDGAARRLATPPPGMTLDTLAAQFPEARVVSRDQIPTGFEGELAIELRNITFAGEQKAANTTLRSFAAFVAADTVVRSGGDIEPATAAFKTFDHDLMSVIDINKDAFDRAVDHGVADLAGFDIVNPLATLGVFALAVLGLRPRLREYSF